MQRGLQFGGPFACKEYVTISNALVSFQVTSDCQVSMTFLGEDGERVVMTWDDPDDLAAIMSLFKEAAMDLHEGQKYGFQYLVDKYGLATELELDPDDFN